MLLIGRASVPARPSARAAAPPPGRRPVVRVSPSVADGNRLCMVAADCCRKAICAHANLPPSVNAVRIRPLNFRRSVRPSRVAHAVLDLLVGLLIHVEIHGHREVVVVPSFQHPLQLFSRVAPQRARGIVPTLVVFVQLPSNFDRPVGRRSSRMKKRS